MSQLIITLIAITLFSCLAIAGVNYLNHDKMMVYQEEGRMRSGLVQLRSAVTIYYNNFGVFPDNYDDIKINTTSLSFPTGMEIDSYTNDTEAGDQFFCIKSVLNPVIQGTLTSLKKNNPAEKLFISNDCGAKADSGYDKLSSNFYITYYL